MVRTASGPMLRRLVDELPGMVAYWDRDLLLVLANVAYCNFLGRRAEDLHGQHYRAVLGEHVFRANVSFLDATLHGQRQTFVRTLTDSAGSMRHVEVRYEPDTVDGTVVGIFALVTDETAQVEARQDLEEAQDLAGLASWAYRVADRSVTWSPSLYRLIGQDSDLERPDWTRLVTMVHPDDREAVAALTDLSTTRHGHDMTYRLLTADGLRHVHSRGRAVVEEDGGLVMLRGTLQDVTVQTDQAKALELANRQLSDVIAMLGHELRQPLTAMTMHVEHVLQSGPQLDHDHRVSLDTALARARFLDQMLTDILLMIELDSTRMVVRPSRCDLGDLVVQSMPADDVGFNVDVRVESSAEVDVDPVHLRHVLGNLVSNARRHGQPPVAVTVTARGTHVHLCVSDNGGGVSPEFVPHLFDRFVRAGGQSTMRPGSGFGLHIVRELVRANAGEISYRNDSPRGSVFDVSFPVVPQHVTRDSPSKSP